MGRLIIGQELQDNYQNRKGVQVQGEAAARPLLLV